MAGKFAVERMGRLGACRAAVFCCGLIALAGCARLDGPLAVPGPSALPPELAGAVASAEIADGRTGAPLAWEDFVSAALASEVVILGERHDDTHAHALQRALVHALPPGSALSLEFFARDLQPLLDGFQQSAQPAGELHAALLEAGWRDQGRWESFYAPLFEHARASGIVLIASNAPRAYTRIARTEGFAALMDLPESEQLLFALPLPVNETAYFARFAEAMRHHPAEEEGAPPGLGDPEIAAFFRAQQLWDATMAESIAWAHAAGLGPVVHIAGQFHSDYDGGLTLRVRRELPGAATLVASFVPADSGLAEAPGARAEVVITTAGGE